jgi:peptide/nickel transport system permease protein
MIRIGISIAIMVLWAAMALLGPVLPLSPDTIDLPRILDGPHFGAWLGHDDLGRPILDRLIMGAQTSFIVSLWVVIISMIVGTVVGATSAYIGGWLDLVVVRIIDVFLAVPGILLAIALAGVMGPGIENVVIALSIVGWVGYARLSRAQVMALKHRDHVIAAIALGTLPSRIIRRHLIPLITAPLIVEATFGIAGVVIAEAGLSFLGLGVQPPEASWGSMIRDGTRYMLVAPHMVIAPGIAMMLVVLAVNLFGDWLRDRLDVRTRQN